MPARTPKAAVDTYVARLREIAGCVTDRPLLASGYGLVPGGHQVSFVPTAEFVPLRSASRLWRIGISIVENYTIDGDAGHARFDARRIGYWYEVLDLAGREILAFHWHPFGISPVTTPHLHLTSRFGDVDLAGGGSVTLGAMHVPTGAIDLIDFVRFLIADFGVEPRRRDWEMRLRRAATEEREGE